MKLKTLKKKVRKLEARLQEGPAKLAKLKRKLEAMMKANAKKARRKTAARVGEAHKAAKSLTPIQKRKDGPTGRPPVKPAAAKRRSPAKKVRRKLNLSPERRAELAAAMKARWAAKRTAEAKPQNSSAGGDFTIEQVPPAGS